MGKALLRENGYTISHETLEEMRMMGVRMIQQGHRAQDIASWMRLNRSCVFVGFRDIGKEASMRSDRPKQQERLESSKKVGFWNGWKCLASLQWTTASSRICGQDREYGYGSERNLVFDFIQNIWVGF